MEGANLFQGPFTHPLHTCCDLIGWSLCRDVRLIVEGVDKYNNLFATVYIPAPAAPPAPNMSTNGATNGSGAGPSGEESLAEILVKAGFAKVRCMGAETGAIQE